MDTKAAVKAALHHYGPVYLRLGRDDADVIYTEEKEFVIGKSDVLRHEETLLDAAHKTGAIVTVEDHTRIGGLGSAVAEVLVRDCPVPMEQIAINDEFGESGTQETLFEKYGLSTQHILDASKKAVTRKR